MSETIVCVDDEPALCRLFRALLSTTGASVETFTDPYQALEFLEGHEVALVVCDFRMPALSGLDLLARVHKTVPFVMVSGDLDVTKLVEGVRGVTAVLSKPFPPERLIEIARAHLHGAS